MPPKYLPLILIGASMMACSAATHQDGRRQRSRMVTFDCDPSPELTIVFQERTARILRAGAPPTQLRRRSSEAGLAYASSTLSIVRQGKRLTYTAAGAAPITCVQIHSSLW